MRVIELDAANWRNVIDYHNALKDALGSPARHGSNVNAWVDSMIYGRINRIEPPYLIRVTGTSRCPPELRQEIDLLADIIRDAREWKKQHYGVDTDVSFDINP